MPDRLEEAGADARELGLHAFGVGVPAVGPRGRREVPDEIDRKTVGDRDRVDAGQCRHGCPHAIDEGEPPRGVICTPAIDRSSETTSSRCGSKPRSRRSSCDSDRTNTPLTATNSTATPTWADTATRWNRPARRPPAPISSLSEPIASTRVRRNAGSRPIASDVASTSRHEKASARASGVRSTSGSPRRDVDAASLVAHHAANPPSTPPPTARVAASTRTPRTRRPRPAPIAARTARSRCPAAPRASIMPARFVQMMNSTRAPAARSAARPTVKSPFDPWRAAGRTTPRWRRVHGWCPGTPLPAVRTPSPAPRSPRARSRPAGAGRAPRPRTRCDWQPSSRAPQTSDTAPAAPRDPARGLPDPVMPERLGRDADHRVGCAVERDDGSQDVRPAAEGVLPQLVADDGDGVLAETDVLRRLERATASQADSEHREVAGRGVHRADALGGVADDEGSIPHLPARDRLDRRVRSPDVLQIGVRPFGHRAAARRHQQFHDAVRFGHSGNRADERRVHDREQRGIGTDAQRQGQDGHNREAPRSRQAAHRQPDVRAQTVDSPPEPFHR